MKTLGISLGLTGYLCAYVLAAFDATSTLVTIVVGSGFALGVGLCLGLSLISLGTPGAGNRTDTRPLRHARPIRSTR